MKLSRALRLTTPSILTTTTHFDKTLAASADFHVVWEAHQTTPDLASPLRGMLTLVSGGPDGERYRGISAPQMDALRTLTATSKIPLLLATETDSPTVLEIRNGGRRMVLLQDPSTEITQTFDTVIIPGPPDQYTVREPIAGVILAAGPATRFGSPKQLLDYGGQPFVRHLAQTALNAKLAPVVVVTGAYASEVETALQGLPVTIVRNEAWRDGQSTSIRAGVASITTSNPGGVILLAADQPQVTVHVIGALVERHAAEGAAIVAPLAADRRAHPILFDCDTFADLLTLTGDRNGRAIFSNYKVDYIPWHDESLLFDVDTQADYEKLLAWGVKD
jgi:molybdenum cofactor cytidylyltransferase